MPDRYPAPGTTHPLPVEFASAVVPRAGGVVPRAGAVVDPVGAVRPGPRTPVRLADGLAYGGDYNPEQWPRHVWDEDVALMREAGVNLVTLGVFAWGTVEVADDVRDWTWLDDAVALLHAHGIGVDLATPTAAPPSWLHTAHPEVLPFDADLYQQPPGGRLAWCPSSAVFRRYALRHVEALAQRYGGHPAIRLWHVSNELGGGNARCYCDVSAAAFRDWLADRYGSLDALNAAWGTAQWGHRFGTWEEVLPPRGKHGAPNPGLHLDYERYSSDALLAHYLAEKAVIERHSAVPVTTNMMVGPGAQVVDYATWAPHTALVANDHYTLVDDPDREHDLAMAGDRMRGMSPGGVPWLLMEHSTGAPSWQQRNRAKDPGEIARNALAHVARGSDGALFFQWRASAAGAEQFHSAMLPHSGTRSRVWREVVALGADLRALAEVRGTVVEPARAAMVVDDVAGWALQHGLKPHRGLRYGRELRTWHRALWERNVLCDVVPPGTDLDAYDLVVAPTLLVLDDAEADRLRAVPARGGTLLTTYLTGVCEPTGQVRPGLGALADVLGAWTDEFYPLQAGEHVDLDDGSVVTDWTERVELDGAEAVVRYATSSLAGWPAVTRRAVPSGGERRAGSTHGVGSTHEAGTAWYVSAMLPRDGVDRVVDRVLAETGLAATAETDPGVEAVRRVPGVDGGRGSYLFLLNRTADEKKATAAGTDLLTGTEHGPVTVVPPGGVRVLRER